MNRLAKKKERAPINNVLQIRQNKISPSLSSRYRLRLERSEIFRAFDDFRSVWNSWIFFVLFFWEKARCCKLRCNRVESECIDSDMSSF